MNKQVKKTNSSLRFRRWSRAGYAVFCSLTCCVTIGCLAIAISDKSLQKAVGTASIKLNITEYESDEKLKEHADFELVIQQLQETGLMEKTLESATSCGINKYFIFKSNG